MLSAWPTPPRPRPPTRTPHAFLATVTPDRRRHDAERVLDLMERIIAASWRAATA
ncbi:hypothetical protein [Cellulomonas sp. NPDC089187]|uniref:hypothetical protein n=1 Tax=Cellulomonas sp. NPDC089187 TaxID=3154970 RepID=UPI003414D602